MAQPRLIQWPNTKIRKLQDDLLTYIRAIERWSNVVDTKNRDLQCYLKLKSSYEAALNILHCGKLQDNWTEPPSEYISIDDPIKTLEKQLANYDANIDSCQTDIAILEKRISEYKALRLRTEFEINSLDAGSVDIDVKTLRKQLRSDRVKSIRFKTNIVNGQEQFQGISVTLNPGTATVRNTRYPIEPVISIPACTIHITSPLNTLKIKPKRNEGSRGFNNSLSAHPHVLSYYEPCLGDFGGPFWEAIDDRDLVSALSILLLFLETVDADDAAGRYWNSWFWLNKNELIMRCDYCNKAVELHDPYTHYSDCEYHPDYTSTDELAEALADFNDEAQAADDMYLSRID